MEIFKVENDNNFILRSNCYVIISKNNFLVVDPSMPLEFVTEKIAESLTAKSGDLLKRFKNFGVIITHCHADHIAHINDYVKANFKIFLTEKTLNFLNDSNVNLSKMILFKELKVNLSKLNYQILVEGKNLIFNEEVFVKFCKGHTEDGQMFVMENYLFSGDLIFESGSVGRTDFPTGNEQQLLESLSYLENLDQNLIVCPGHGNNFKLFEFNVKHQ